METNAIRPIHPQLRFGVNLSRLYPEWYLHPALKNLIYETQVNTERRKESTLETIFADENSLEYQKNLDECLYLKDRLISGKSILGLNASPGVHLWLLRHFLGSLPLPLFPKDNIRPNSWINLSVQCKDILIAIRIKAVSPRSLEEVIARELTQLPSRNLILIIELFELFRILGTKLFVKSDVDKRSSMAIVKYFAPCLFNRPFRPGVIMTNDKRHFALVLFMIFFWPSIKQKCQNMLLNTATEFYPSKLYYLPSIKEEEVNTDTEEFPSENKLASDVKYFEELRNTIDDNMYLVDNQTQTSFQSFEYWSENLGSSTPFRTAQIHADQNEDKYRNNFTSDASPLHEGKDLLCESLISLQINPKDEQSKHSVSTLQKSKDTVSKLNFLEKISENEGNLTNLISFDDSKYSRYKLRINDKKNTEIKINLFESDKGTSINKDLMELPNNTLFGKPTEDQGIQVGSPRKKPKTTKISKKAVRLKRSYKRDSQIIILHINPCNCARKERKSKERKLVQEKEEIHFEEKDNFESPEKRNSKVQNETILDNPNFCCKYTKGINTNFGTVRNPYGWSNVGCSTDDEYIYDSFIGFPQENTVPSLNLPSSNPFNDVFNEQPKAKPVELRERMAKIGWTYDISEPSTSPRTEPEKLPSPYQLCFDAEFKPVDFSKKESSFIINLKKFGSKINIFKSFTPKLSKLSISAENLLPDIKYKKISKRSNSF